MENQKLKADMVENGLYRQLKDLNKALYKETGANMEGIIHRMMLTEEYSGMYDFYTKRELRDQIINDIAKGTGYSFDEIKAFLQLAHARKENKRRIGNHIQFLRDKGYILFFVTFTFNDENIGLKEKTLIDYTTRLLNSYPFVVDFIFNRDYGEKNDRFHLHGILAIEPNTFEPTYRPIKHKGKTKLVVDNMPIEYTKGWACYQRIGNTKDDDDKVKNYEDKLTLHSLKVKQTRLIIKKNSEYHNVVKGG